MEPKTDPESSSVNVAVRVRPLIGSQKVQSPQICVSAQTQHNTIRIGKDRQFVFDRVFDMNSKQSEVFQNCAVDLVISCFKGYNATVLAYGQTGSGKTFTMGSALRSNILDEQQGIIPRVITKIFQEVQQRKSKAEFIIKVSFLEIYNEEILDLLTMNNVNPDKPISIREDKGTIMLMGLHEQTVATAEQMANCLDRGSFQRSTASTLMNATSSRSHAIFTIAIQQQQLPQQEDETEGVQQYTMAKFHFVDLAGSERAKRTGASGATLKQGININRGLLCLGNVISALTENTKGNMHVPYRDSKLTRILQDSLGGNAKTYMIACISPAEINFEETLNTLKYASRARHIKNKPVINRDPQSAMVAQLRQEVYSLKQELRNYQKLLTMNGGDLAESLAMLKTQDQETDDQLRTQKLKNQQLDKKLASVSAEFQVTRQTCNEMEVQNLQLKRERDMFKFSLEKANALLAEAGMSVQEECENSLFDQYSILIEKLKKEVKQKDLIIQEMKYENDSLVKEAQRDAELLKKKTQEIQRLKRNRPMDDFDFQQELFRNVDDYGRIFAQNVIAQLELPQTQEQQPIELQLVQQQQTLDTMDKGIQQKKTILQNIQQEFKQMNSKLLQEMNQQYHKKIEQYQQELNRTIKERNLAFDKIKASSQSDKHKVGEKYRVKIQQLEQRLKQSRKKDREQTALYKRLQQQKTHISKLSEQIRKDKQLKVSYQRKIKEKEQALQKQKMSSQRTFVQMKRDQFKKDQIIQKLKHEDMRNKVINKRKTEELAAIQRRQREISMRRNKGSLMNKETIQKWISDLAQACNAQREIRNKMIQENKQKENVQQELTQLSQQSASIRLFIQRKQYQLNLGDTLQDPEQVLKNLQQKRFQLKQLELEIETLDEKLQFKQEKLIEYSQILGNSQVQSIKAKGLSLKTVQDSQDLISSLFDQIIAKIEQIRKQERVFQSKDLQIASLNQQLKTQLNQKILIKKQQEIQINKLISQFEQTRKLLIEQLEQARSSQHVIVPVQLQQQPIQQKIEDLQKINNNQKLEIQSLKTSNQAVNTKYMKLRKAFIDIKESFTQLKQEEDRSLPRTSINSLNSLSRARDLAKKKKQEDVEVKPRSSNLTLPAKEEENVWERLNSRGSRSSSSVFSPTETVLFKPKQKWLSLNSLQAHTGAVCSMISNQNILYSASNKTFKVWSLDTMTQISEVPAHNSFIRCMAFWPQSSMIFTGCGGQINIWDAISLQSLACLRGHNQQVRALFLQDHYLYSAGKASNQGNSIFLWDLRKSRSPVHQKEKNQEVFSIIVNQNTLYYGSRNHRVGRININTFQSMRPYEPPHFDTVTSLAIYQNSIVSGSRDKNLRRWDLAGETPYPTVLTAHNDWVNHLGVSFEGDCVYSAGKEGKIRVWQDVDSILVCVGEVPGHASSVNCLVSLDGRHLISGGTDKMIKIWKMNDDD